MTTDDTAAERGTSALTTALADLTADAAEGCTLEQVIIYGTYTDGRSGYAGNLRRTIAPDDLRELLAEHKALRRQVQEARVIALRDISEPGTGICPTAYQIYLATGGQPLARDAAADVEADLRAARDMLRKHDDRSATQHEAAADIQDLTYEILNDHDSDPGGATDGSD